MSHGSNSRRCDDGAGQHPLDQLLEEHALQRAVLQAVERELQRPPDDRSLRPAFWGQLLDFLLNFVDRHHADREEKLLFPVFAAQQGAAGRIIVQRLRAAHERFRAAQHRLAEAVQRRTLAPVQHAARALATLWRAHLDDEESVLLRPCRRLLDPQVAQMLRAGLASLSSCAHAAAGHCRCRRLAWCLGSADADLDG